MKKFWNTLLGLILGYSVFGQLDDLMIVEYVDWSSGDGLAVKIYNPTSAVINLTGYSISTYNNGSLTPNHSVNLSGSMMPGDVRVAGNSGYPCTKNFTLGTGVNGNDAIALLKNGVFVDMVNMVGANYGANNGLFYHNRLIRKNNNCVRYTAINGASSNSWPSHMIFSHNGWNTTATQCFGSGSPYTPHRDTVQNFMQICQGDSVLINGVYRSTAGSYYETFTSSSFCDSVVEIQLFLHPMDLMGQNLTLCEGDSAFLENAWRSLSGVYYDTLSGSNGCDSVLQTLLDILPRLTSSDTLDICQGDSVMISQNWESQAGMYSDTLTASNGCDSISSVLLRVSPALVTNTNTFICAGDSILLQNSWQKMAGTYYDTLAAANGCDSVLVTNVLMLPVTQSEDTVWVCEGDSVFIAGSWQYTPGSYADTMQTAEGCDSIVTTRLMNFMVLAGARNLEICRGDSIFVGGSWQSSAGLYADTLTAINGCDSLLYTQLNIVDNFTGYKLIGLCPEDSVQLAGQYYSDDTLIVYTIANPMGCDSTITAEIRTYKLNADFEWSVHSENEQKVIFKNHSSPDSGVQWSFGDGTFSEETDPVHTYSNPGLYTVDLTIVNVNGCRDSATDQIAVLAPEPETEFFIPNTFTPNDDGVNDFFRISVQGNPVFYISIYNRWGQKLFESGDSKFQWSGKFQGQDCPDGVYTYQIGGAIQKTGVIHIIR